MPDPMEFLFERSGRLFGVPASSVVEAVFIPEIALAAEAPSFVLGLIDVRGAIVAVMDLDRRLGLPYRAISIRDRVLFLESNGRTAGIVVDDVLDVAPIPESVVQAPPEHDVRDPSLDRFLRGVARVETRIALLLDVDRLVRLPEWNGLASTDSTDRGDGPGENGADGTTEDRSFAAAVHRIPDANQEPTFEIDTGSPFGERLLPEEAAILRERAEALAQPLDPPGEGDRVPLAVFGIGDELYGVELTLIREFVIDPPITPIPCCPDRILGCTSIRGEIVPIVEIRSVLDAPSPESRPIGGAIIVQSEGVAVGIAVDQIQDVCNVDRATVTAPGIGADSNALIGTAPYLDRMFRWIDLRKILESESLVVDERVD